VTRTRHGLVIGKFYPPHAGHHLLISTAAACSDRVTVLVMSHEVESIPNAHRVEWLREAHADEPHVTFHGAVDNHPIDYGDPAVWDRHEAEFRAGLAAVTDEPVSAVFSSEPYGAELARRFGAVAVAVDDGRDLEPVSGTEVRADPVAHWGRLSPAVRAWFTRRVVVIGAESTGTTTLSGDLVDALRERREAHGLTRGIPEYGRDFTVVKLAAARASAGLAGQAPPAVDELVWRTQDFVTIAARQNALEDAAARLGGPVLVCDTDAFATGVWHERYLDGPDAEVDELARHHPLYLLTHDDGVAFQQDGIRDGEHIRRWMTDRFIEAMDATGRRFVVLRGNREERLAAALGAIDELLAEGWGLADPVTPPNRSASR
jgi:NadR type nicotinamide-nucleotide adenylyltransferase